ncbi:MAG: Rrf2 family transcriptional regulator [Myxococcales bacterium]|nr:Rrf2 family transcriptional regulator [Myxococcales bacterium]
MELTKASKIGLYALVEMALNPEERLSASAISDRFAQSENHVAKVLQQLQRAGLVTSTRGVGGGYELARPASKLTVADVVRCLEGPLANDPCVDCPLRRDDKCHEGQLATCRVHGLLEEISSHIYYTLESVTIATLARGRSL